LPVKGIDHVAIPTGDSERFLEFYKRLGFRFLNEERWRKGESRIFSLIVGENNIINVHPAGFTAHLRGETATPGCGDICFVWDGTTQEVLDMLDRAEVKPIEGPSPRTGGRGTGTVLSKSVYIRDPDGNLLEFMVYSGEL
jgi:catechol 2,3-dioxygenase-like lactoylglutathione lyase family enzyme